MFKMELKIKKIEHKTIDSENVSGESVYVMHLEGTKTGFPKVTIKAEEPFIGYQPGNYVKMSLKNDQKTLDESIKMPGAKKAGREVKSKEAASKKVLKAKRPKTQKK